MLTPKDIENSDRKSGYQHVGDATSHGSRLRGATGTRWRAVAPVPNDTPSGRGTGVSVDNGGAKKWRGPVRKTPLKAAQDYCDYINDNNAVTPAKLKTVGHPSAKRKNTTPEQQVALDILRDARAKDDDPGVVYLVIENNDWTVGKVGWTGQEPPECRLGDYQAGNRRPLAMKAQFPGTKADERALHKKYIEQNELGEWFRLTDGLLLEFKIIRKKAA